MLGNLVTVEQVMATRYCLLLIRLEIMYEYDLMIPTDYTKLLPSCCQLDILSANDIDDSIIKKAREEPKQVIEEVKKPEPDERDLAEIERQSLVTFKPHESIDESN